MFETCDNWGFSHYTLSDHSMLCRCEECGKYYFMGANGIYGCPCCGYYDGDNGFERVMDYYLEDKFSDTKLWDVARRARFEYGEK